MTEYAPWVEAAAVTLIAILGWLFSHAMRLRAVEVRQEELRRSFDGHATQVLNALTRIEDKMDRKADRL